MEHRALSADQTGTVSETGMVGNTIIRLDFIYSAMLLNTRKFRRKVEYTGQLSELFSLNAVFKKMN